MTFNADQPQDQASNQIQNITSLELASQATTVARQLYPDEQSRYYHIPTL